MIAVVAVVAVVVAVVVNFNRAGHPTTQFFSYCLFRRRSSGTVNSTPYTYIKLYIYIYIYSSFSPPFPFEKVLFFLSFVVITP